MAEIHISYHISRTTYICNMAVKNNYNCTLSSNNCLIAVLKSVFKLTDYSKNCFYQPAI